MSEFKALFEDQIEASTASNHQALVGRGEDVVEQGVARRIEEQLGRAKMKGFISNNDL